MRALSVWCAAAIVAAAGTGWAGATQEGPPPAYDTTKIELPKGHRTWTMVRTFIVADKSKPAYGIRNAFFNGAALEALQKGGTTYPDDAQIAMALHEIMDAPEGRQTQGAIRGTFLMVRDGKQYAATDGWGYARFDARGGAGEDQPAEELPRMPRGRGEARLGVHEAGQLMRWPFERLGQRGLAADRLPWYLKSGPHVAEALGGGSGGAQRRKVGETLMAMRRAALVAVWLAGMLAVGATASQGATGPVRLTFKLAPEVGYTVHADGFGEPQGLAISAAGDLYVADQKRNEVVRIGRDGRREVVARDVRGAQHVAIDPLGALYVAATAQNQVIKVSPHGLPSVYLDGLAGPVELGWDAQGALLVCEFAGNAVRAFTSPSQRRVFVRAEGPYGLASQREGITLVAENGPGRILRVQPDGRTERLAEGLQGPEGIAVGPSGDLYVAETRAGRLSRIRPDGTRQTLVEGLSAPRGPVFDAYGQLFLSERGTGRILRFTGDF